MRFDRLMVDERIQVMRLVQEGVLSQKEAAEKLGRSVRQIRRLARRLEGTDDAVAALSYQREHAAPNRLADGVRERVHDLTQAHPHWSTPAIREALEDLETSPLPSERTVRRWMEEAGSPPTVGRRERPARRFEAPRPLCLVQMDTTSGQWLTGKRSAHVIVTLDDYSRAVLAGRAVEADSTVNNLTVLEAAVERYGAMEVLYSDNGSVFRTTRYARSRFHSYRPEVLAGEELTQLARAVSELGAVPLTHQPGNARAKGKLERWNRFFQERVLPDGPFANATALDEALQHYLVYYNQRHVHRIIGCVPAARLEGHTPKPLPTGSRPLRDICSLLQTRKVAKDHTFSLDGVTYQLPHEPNLVAFTVELRIRPGATIRVWHDDRQVAELPHGDPTPLDGLTVDQVLEQILPRITPKPPKTAPGATP